MALWKVIRMRLVPGVAAAPDMREVPHAGLHAVTVPCDNMYIIMQHDQPTGAHFNSDIDLLHAQTEQACNTLAAQRVETIASCGQCA